MVTKRSIQRELYKLLDTFFFDRDFFIYVKCLELYNAYDPTTDEVATYKYKVNIVVKDDLYVYDGWCYPNELRQIALGIFSYWLVDNYKIYDGASTAWYNSYTCYGNIVEKDKVEKQFEKDKKLYEEDRSKVDYYNGQPCVSICISKDGIKYE